MDADVSRRLVANPTSSAESEVHPLQVPGGALARGALPPLSKLRPWPCHMCLLGLYQKLDYFDIMVEN